MSGLTTAAVVVGSVALYILVALGLARLWRQRTNQPWHDSDDLVDEALVYGLFWPITVLVLGMFRIILVARKFVSHRNEPENKA
ncbi:hypothetical protein [Embleya sp. NPDC059237]|uniref:hypothetical protein n=1 Tax=Embleya sp. NPDC059237 TaxID=3346784 RepID=UPI0036C0F184